MATILIKNKQFQIVEQLRSDYLDSAAEVVERLAALPEWEMRVSSLVGHLEEVGDLQAVWTLESVVRGALFKDTESLAVYAGMVPTSRIARVLGANRVAEFVDVGTTEGCRCAVLWLRAPSADGEWGSGSDVDVQMAAELRDRPLGDRRALARKATGTLLNKLLWDRDPVVIKHLLDNPRTTERMVLKITSRRPTSPVVLEAVLESPRWAARYDIKRSLINNPYLPMELAINLLVYLNRPDLTAARDEPTLDERLRYCAQQLLDCLGAVSEDPL